MARPGPLHPRRAAGGADALLAVRRGVGGRRPALGRRRSPRAAPASRTRARSWSPLALAEAPLEGRDELWLDLCAGPGGKAGLLAALAAERGARLVASERLPVRAGLVRRTLTADGGPVPGVVGVVAADGTLAPYRAGIFDRVLVDAPCTGLGALRRRPEARWRRKPDDLLALVMLQRQLVRAALDLVRPGGVVLYATCSPVLSETSSVVTSVHGARTDAELEDLGPAVRRRARLARGRSPAPSSCGRTGTAPTRCSWRCSAGARPVRDLVEHVAQVAAGGSR